MNFFEESLEENVGFKRSRTADRRPFVTLACEHGGSVKEYKKPIVDNDEEEIPKKRLQDLRRSSCNRLSSSGRVMCPPHNILRFLREQDVGCAVRVWTSQVLHFEVEKTNCAESEHYVLKLWLSTCHGDLDTVFLNIDSLIQEEDVDIFGRKLEIGSDIPEEYDRDMDSEIRDLISLIQEISTGPISKVWEVRRLIKGVISLVLPEDPCQPLTTLPETAVTKGRQKTNSIKRDKSHWEYVSIAHKKIGKSSGSGFGSGSGSGSGSGPSPRGRGLTTVLPLLSNMDGNTGIIFIGFIEEQKYFIQLHLRDGCPLPPLQVKWEHHRDVRVSGWAVPYPNQIVDWVTRYREMSYWYVKATGNIPGILYPRVTAGEGMQASVPGLIGDANIEKYRYIHD
ncbi:hypothetical protein M9H77_22544 [Catharanthus roseus]|uniref:Uncharacterized protein n=1 Tax=Catharanthus roseus TaxID=4058 RepID=A0ACC0AR62_CATRO|nr:hypothetical protein M9H77_22544 [Catharanthus roseus]